METYIREVQKHVHDSVSTAVPKTSFDDDKVVSSLDLSMKHPDSFSETSWKCSICFGIPREAVSLKVCGHVGCFTCFNQVLATDNSSPRFDSPGREVKRPCPVCRTMFDDYDVVGYNEWPLLAKQVWAQLRIKCEACEFVSDPISLLQHERSTCAHRRLKCTGCWFAGTESVIVTHMLQCKDTMVNCILCGYPIRLIEQAKHSCARVRHYLTMNTDVVLIPGPLGAVTKAPMSADEWATLFDDGRDPYVSYMSNPVSLSNFMTPPARPLEHQGTRQSARPPIHRTLPRLIISPMPPIPPIPPMPRMPPMPPIPPIPPVVFPNITFRTPNSGTAGGGRL